MGEYLFVDGQVRTKRVLDKETEREAEKSEGHGSSNLEIF